MNFEQWYAKAKSKGWALPTAPHYSLFSWMVYWSACEAHERDPKCPQPTTPKGPYYAGRAHNPRTADSV